MEQVARKNRLKELRMKALLNQKELSLRSGVSPWTISKIEHGLRMPQVSVVRRRIRSPAIAFSLRPQYQISHLQSINK